ncbi:metalloregulator ArsR/SmtB family transcription factor [Inquilinus limosus]|uniref:ArsR/SmtB family transcription factor n=1 Tax=Inquilinus limosus TaxID=171674 RepID=UPI003F16ECF3
MQALDRIFVALSDPNRRRMAERLSRGPATVKQLAEPVEMRLPSAVKHLKVLEDSGIVVSRKDGRARTYSLQPAALMLIADWVRDRETALNAAFDRLEAAMREIPEGETQP